jgi:hypothetical protein
MSVEMSMLEKLCLLMIPAVAALCWQPSMAQAEGIQTTRGKYLVHDSADHCGAVQRECG